MVRGLGLVVIHESARFEPERGAYHGHAHPASPEASQGKHPHRHDAAGEPSAEAHAALRGHHH
jgi:hypothetical protein